MRVIILLVLIASSLLATINPVASVPPETTVYRVFNSSDKLWFAGLNAGGNSGVQTLVGNIENNQITNLVVDKVSTNLVPKRVLWRGTVQWSDVYTKGKTVYIRSTLGPNAPNYPEGRLPQTYFDKIEGGVGSPVCTSTGTNFGPKPLEISGGFVGSDNEIYFDASNKPPTGLPSGFPFDEEYSLYKLKSSTNFGAACSFEKVHTLEKGYRILQAWRMPDGRFLAERYSFPATKVATEIGIIELDGKFSPFQIGGEECCQLLVNTSDYSASVLYKNSSKPFVRTIKDGRLGGLYEVRGFNNSEPVWLSWLNGLWGVLTGAGSGRQTQDTIVLMNTQTGVQKAVVSGGKVGTVDVQNIEMAHVSVSPSGDVAFQLRVGPTGIVYREVMVTIPPTIISLSADKTKIGLGEQVKIRWESKDGLKARLYAGTAILQDDLPASGEVTVAPNLTTLYEIEVLGFGGSAKSSVSVEVTTSTTPKPEYGVQGLVSVFYHSPEKSEAGCREFSPGAAMSLYGSNLSVGRTEVSTSTSLATILAGTSVWIDGTRAPLYFVSPGQVNFQVPTELLGGTQAKLWVESAGVKGPEMTIFIKDVSPCYLRNPDGSIYFAETGGIKTFYATGLGKTDPVVESGSPTPTDALFRTVFVPTDIDGKPIDVLYFSGLAPGFIGLYQTNATVREQ